MIQRDIPYHTHSEYGASTCEVVNQLQVSVKEPERVYTYLLLYCVQVKSKVPWLAGVLKLLQETQELSQDLIDKVCHILAACMGLVQSFFPPSGHTVQGTGATEKMTTS